jgi:hypothetical protein
MHNQYYKQNQFNSVRALIGYDPFHVTKNHLNESSLGNLIFESKQYTKKTFGIPHLYSKESHYVLIYYVNDCDGDTLLFDDKEKIEPKLLEIQSLDKDGIKQRYKELRRSGANTHGQGGGIGFYEIAKRCDSIEHEFKQINENKFYFHLMTTITTQK